VGYAAADHKPLHPRLGELILTSGKIAVDETVAPALERDCLREWAIFLISLFLFRLWFARGAVVALMN
jgi:hypothetical protein